MSLYGGIDLHSSNNHLSIVTERQKEVFRHKSPNDLGQVLRVLAPYQQDIEGIAVESTYNWYWLVDGLMDVGYRAHLVNTNAAQQYERLKYTDDRYDARFIAVMLSLGILPEGYIYPKEDRPLRDLCRRRAFLKEKKTSMMLSMRGTYERWTGSQPTRKEMHDWTGEDLALELGDPETSLGMGCFLESISVLTEQIAIIEKRLLEKAQLREEFRLLETVWGIGKILALTVMYEVGDINRFRSVGNFASYCRCVQSGLWSNNKRKGKGNPKNGNPYLSWAFSEAAHFASQHRPLAKRFCQRKKAKTNGIVANRALAHKLARASYYVMKDKVEFDPNKLFPS